jgi:hypothetical protein
VRLTSWKRCAASPGESRLTAAIPRAEHQRAAAPPSSPTCRGEVLGVRLATDRPLPPAKQVGPAAPGVQSRPCGAEYHRAGHCTGVESTALHYTAKRRRPSSETYCLCFRPIAKWPIMQSPCRYPLHCTLEECRPLASTLIRRRLYYIETNTFVLKLIL